MTTFEKLRKQRKKIEYNIMRPGKKPEQTTGFKYRGFGINKGVTPYGAKEWSLTDLSNGFAVAKANTINRIQSKADSLLSNVPDYHEKGTPNDKRNRIRKALGENYRKFISYLVSWQFPGIELFSDLD